MEIEQGKQYDFNVSSFFEDGQIINASLFIYENKIYIVSFVNDERLSKHVFNKNYELIGFEGYSLSSFDIYEAINELTTCFSKELKKCNYLETKINIDLIKKFNIVCDNYSIERAKLRYSFIQYEIQQIRKNQPIENHLFKEIMFHSVYAKQFNETEEKTYLYLNLFKEEDTYWYCIENAFGEKVCKFVFKVEDLPEKYLFHLIQRENYCEGSETIDFDLLCKSFGSFHGSFHMANDLPDEDDAFFKSCKFSYLNEIFKEQKKLPLSI